MPEPLPPLEDYTFEGYRNADGSVGTKNLLGITTSVHCMADVVNYVVKIIDLLVGREKAHEVASQLVMAAGIYNYYE